MKIKFTLSAITFFLMLNPCFADDLDNGLSEKLGFPELPQLGINLSASRAISAAIVNPEKEYPDVTDGIALKDEKGNLVVLDDIKEPSCVFYGTYSTGYNSGDINSKVNINNLQLDCN